MVAQESKIKWAAFLKGDDKAYEWIYKCYIHDLYRYGIRFTLDKELAKDCIQEVFTNIYKNRKQLTVPDNVKVYLFICLKNNLLRVLQKESTHEMTELETMPFLLEPTVEELFIEKELQSIQKEEVNKILSLLTPRQQEIIYYRFVQEMSFEEIGLLMDLNYQSAQNLIQRSLKKLREHYRTVPPAFFIFLSYLR